MKGLNWLQSRLTEPSTHNGIGLLMIIASAVWPQYAQVLQIAAGVFGGMGIAMPDAKTIAGNPAAFIPPVHIAANPAVAEAINKGVQAAITHLLTPPAK